MEGLPFFFSPFVSTTTEIGHSVSNALPEGTQSELRNKTQDLVNFCKGEVTRIKCHSKYKFHMNFS